MKYVIRLVMNSSTFSVLFCLLAFNIVSCAPLHIKEHQTEGNRGRCNLGSSTAYISNSPLAVYSISIRQVKEFSEIRITMQAKEGQIITVFDSSISFKQSGVAQTVPAKILTGQFNKKNGMDKPRYGTWEVGVPYVFQSDKDYTTGYLTLETRIPFNTDKLEVETGKIKVGDQFVEPQSVRFKFNDRWTIVPLNGC